LPQDIRPEEQTPPEVFRPRYPAIEKLIDSEDFESINKNFGLAYEELEKLSKQKGLGSASQAKKAMKALEKVMDLLKDLLKLKYQYMAAQEKGGEESPQEKKSGDTQLQGNRVR
jgi:hypothetical protein